MNRIVNKPDFVVEDMLKGYLKANKESVMATDNPRVVKYVGAPVEGKVGVVTGGGSGHKPAFIGYVGKICATPSRLARYFLLRLPPHFWMR